MSEEKKRRACGVISQEYFGGRILSQSPPSKKRNYEAAIGVVVDSKSRYFSVDVHVNQPLDAMLVHVNPVNGINKFIVLQVVLHSGNNKKLYAR